MVFSYPKILLVQTLLGPNVFGQVTTTAILLTQQVHSGTKTCILY